MWDAGRNVFAARLVVDGAVAGAAEIGGADLEFTGPFYRRVGEDVGADVGDAEAEITHLGKMAEEVTDVLVGGQVAGVGVVKAIV